MEKTRLIRILTVILVYTVILCGVGPEHFNGMDDEKNALKKIENRIYYTLTTISTVGYGDITPKTRLSRFITSSMMMILILEFLN